MTGAVPWLGSAPPGVGLPLSMGHAVTPVMHHHPVHVLLWPVPPGTGLLWTAVELGPGPPGLPRTPRLPLVQLGLPPLPRQELPRTASIQLGSFPLGTGLPWTHLTASRWGMTVQVTWLGLHTRTPSVQAPSRHQWTRPDCQVAVAGSPAHATDMPLTSVAVLAVSTTQPAGDQPSGSQTTQNNKPFPVSTTQTGPVSTAAPTQTSTSTRSVSSGKGRSRIMDFGMLPSVNNLV